MLEDALHECYSVAIAHGIHLPADSVANTLAYIDSLTPRHHGLHAARYHGWSPI